jgi:HAD superfamily hydrolase (TIGR01549 family)
MKIRAIIFDMDGTVVDAPYDWDRIRKELNTQGIPILTFLNSLKEPERTKKWKILEKYEKEATSKAVLMQGIPKFLEFLRSKKIKRALVTNNSRKNVSFLVKKFDLMFDFIVSRESGLWKPSGAPFIFALTSLGIKAEECCVIGNSHFDIKAAEEAGIEKIFLLSRERDAPTSLGAEIFTSVSDIQKKVENVLNSIG